jgi:hypothetical protein
MSTFLQICQSIRQEAGISGTGPLSVVNQTGEYKRVVDWARSAWLDIQLADPTWRWMRGSFTFVTTPGQGAYTPAEAGIASRFSHWMLEYTSLGLTPPNDDQLIQPLSYDEFRTIYLVGPQPASRPVCVTVAPDQRLLLGYTPNDAYTVRGEYQKTPQMLALDTDVPEMPEQYHEAIVYRALMKYARYEAAPEVMQDAAYNYGRLMMVLRNHQMPMVTGPESLA